MSIVSVKNIRKSFRPDFWKPKKLVLDDVSFEIEKGHLTGFLGSNGAGKTTSLKCILGLIFADSGEITYFDGQAFTKDVRRKIGFLPERPYFYEYLKASEFLVFYSRLTGIQKNAALMKKIDELLELVDLTHAKEQLLRSFSKGMLQRIGIAQALIHDPEFVILDEPMTGLDPDGRMKISQIMRNAKASGKTLFFSSHLLHDAETLCENLVILKYGKRVYQGKTIDLLESLQTGYKVYFKEKQRDDLTSVDLESEMDLQKKIDDLRKSESTIINVQPIRPSLERAFLDIAKGSS